MQNITISGNLGKDAELRTVRDSQVLSFLLVSRMDLEKMLVASGTVVRSGARQQKCLMASPKALRCLSLVN
jgi:single-stranded DNA-binding protein